MIRLKRSKTQSKSERPVSKLIGGAEEAIDGEVSHQSLSQIIRSKADRGSPSNDILTDLKVTGISSQDRILALRLIALGIVAGAVIRVLPSHSPKGAITIETGRTRVSMLKSEAQAIMVRRTRPGDRSAV